MIDASDQSPLTRGVVALAHEVRGLAEHYDDRANALCEVIAHLETTVKRLERLTDDLWNIDTSPDSPLVDDVIPF